MPTNLVRIYSLLRYSLVSCFVDDDSSSVPTFGGMSRAKRKPVFKKGKFDDTHCRDVFDLAFDLEAVQPLQAAQL